MIVWRIATAVRLSVHASTRTIATWCMPREAVKAQRLDAGHPAERTEALQFSQSLELIYDLNRRMLALLAEPIDEGGAYNDFHVGTPIGQVLRDIDPSTRQQLALCPFLLLDASFTDAARWKPPEAVQQHVEAAPSQTNSATRAIALGRATCVLSWHLVRTDQVAARLVLGVSPECAAVIAQSGLTELQELAARFVRHRWFKPRWHDRPDAWRRLIRLAHMTPRTTVAIHGLQLFLGDLLGEEGH